MPTTETIIWLAISGLIVLMLNTIKSLLAKGFDGLRAELAKIWERLESNNKETGELRAEIEKVKARCEERGLNCPGGHHHRRVTDEGD